MIFYGGIPLTTSQVYIKTRHYWFTIESTVIRGDFRLLGWLQKSSLNCNISMAILSFSLFFSDSPLYHSDVSLATIFELIKVFRFEEERRVWDISSTRIKQPFLTYFCIFFIFLYVVKLEGLNVTKNLICLSNCMLFYFY